MSWRRVIKLAQVSACLLLLAVSATAYGVRSASRFAKFENIRVHYLVSGHGADALIYIHGWACDANFWRGQISAFPSRRSIAIDLPGHGLSDKPHANYTLDYFARSIEAVMRDAKVNRAVLIGHSMGAPIVARFYGRYPERTLALVIVDGAMRPFLPRADMDALILALRKDYATETGKLVESMLAPVRDNNIKKQIRRTMLSTPAYVGISAMAGMADENAYETDPIKVPVLAVLAESHGWPADNESFLRKLAPTLEVQMWKDVSHFLMMEEPEEFNELVRAFLN